MNIHLKDIVYLGFLIAAFLVGFYRYKYLSRPSALLFLLLLCTLISEVTAEVLRYTVHNNLIVFHLYNPIQYVFLALAFNVELRMPKFVYLSIACYILFALVNGLTLQPFFDEYCSYSVILNIILVSGLCLYYLYELLQQDTESSFFDYPLFWISVGYLLYNVSNLLGLGAFNSLSDNKEISLILGTVRTLSNYVLYTMFAIAFLSRQKELINYAL